MVSGVGSSPEWAAYAKELALNLRRLRHARGLTQEAVAERAGISLYGYQQYERGFAKKDQAINPRIATLLALCQVFDVTLAELMPPTAPRLSLG